MKIDEITVAFVLRADGLEKPGGDTSKVARFRAQLVERGHVAEIGYGRLPEFGRKPDVVHLVNSDLPVENLQLLQLATDIGAKTVLSTVHHPIAGVREFYESGEDGFYRRCKAARLDFERAVTLRENLKLLSRRNSVSVPSSFLRTTDMQRELLDGVDLLLPMSPGEEKAIIQDTGTTSAMHLVPNGVTYTPQGRGTQTSLFDVCIVGRIEPRKNSLAAARALGRSGLQAIFVGATNANHKSYVANFINVIDEFPNLVFAGRQDAQGVRKYMAHSSCYLNPSWFEVVSQADIEAASLGLRIASTKHSYLRDIVAGRFVEIDPVKISKDHDGGFVREVVQSARLVSPPESYPWSAAVEDLVSAYQAL